MQVSFKENDGQLVKLIINHQSEKPTLDCYVDNHIKLQCLTSLEEKDGMIEITAGSTNEDEEEKMEPVKLTPRSREDVNQILTLAQKVGLVSSLGPIAIPNGKGHLSKCLDVFYAGCCSLSIPKVLLDAFVPFLCHADDVEFEELPDHGKETGDRWIVEQNGHGKVNLVPHGGVLGEGDNKVLNDITQARGMIEICLKREKVSKLIRPQELKDIARVLALWEKVAQSREVGSFMLIYIELFFLLSLFSEASIFLFVAQLTCTHPV